MSTKETERALERSEDRHSHRMLSALDKIFHWGLVVTCFVAPFIFLKGIFDFANLPQSAFIQIAVVFLFLVWLIKASIRETCFILKSPLNLPILAFILWSLASTFYAHNKYEGFLAWRPWAASALMFFLVMNDTYEKKRFTHLLAALFISGALCSLLGVVQHLLGFSRIPQAGPPAATFANRNMAAHYVVLTLPLAVGVIVNSKGRVRTLMSGAAACLMILFLSYTKARAAWIALGAEVLFLVALLARERIQNKDSFHWSRNKTLAAVLTVVIVFVTLNVGPRGFKWRIGELLRHVATVTGYEEGESARQDAAHRSIALRRAVWLNTIEMIKDHPWTGLGLGNHKVSYPLYHRKVITERMFSMKSQLKRVHNDLLQAFAELGAVGMILIGWIGFVLVKIILRVTSSPHSREVRFWTIGITLGVVGLLFNSLFSFPFQRAVPPFSFMVLLGVLGSLHAAHDRKSFSIGTRWTLRCACAVVVVGLAWIVRFHYLGIKSDRYIAHAIQMERSKNWHGLLAKAQQAYQCNPSGIKTLSYAGRAYIEMGDYQKGIEALQKVVAAYPNLINALMNLGVAYEKTGDSDNALKAYERVLLIKPDYVKVHINVANIYLRQNKPDKALEEYVIVAELDPKNSVIHYNIGAVQIRNGRYQEAAAAFERAVQLKGKWDAAHKSLGVVYLQFLNRKEEGLKHLKKALKLNPEMRDAEQIRQLIRMAEASN